MRNSFENPAIDPAVPKRPFQEMYNREAVRVIAVAINGSSDFKGVNVQIKPHDEREYLPAVFAGHLLHILFGENPGNKLRVGIPELRTQDVQSIDVSVALA